jgi:pimeloyl-ACP methyl ester carboxylesterase
MSETIKYLNERRENEVTWLETLGRSDVPATLIWGEKDPIARTAIADFVWKNHLRDRPAAAAYWRINCAGHYPQNDQPEAVALLIRQALGGAGEVDFSGSDCTPARVE